MKVVRTLSKTPLHPTETWEDAHFRRVKWARGGKFPRTGHTYVYDPENGNWHKHDRWGWHRVGRKHGTLSVVRRRKPRGYGDNAGWLI